MLARGPGPAWRVASGRLAPPLLASSPRRANSSWGAGCNAAPGWKKARTPSPPPCKRRDPDEPKPWLSTPALKANYRIPTSRLLVVRNLVLDGLDHAPDELRYQLARAMPAWTGADAAGVVHDAFSRVDVPLMPGGKPCGFAYLEVGADSDFHGLRVALDGATLGDRVVTCKAATPMMRVENALTVDHVLALVRRRACF
ncbi:hypothetical protein M885DRAFT_231039 [Pelagophyceae sp. CCMP2097]|nr:hypothetical protein M885DRAFT_231039 [Pelagophyceae sp. CCMP2097]